MERKPIKMISLILYIVTLPAIYITEHLIEHVARTLNKDPLAIKTLNFYKDGQVKYIYYAM